MHKGRLKFAFLSQNGVSPDLDTVISLILAFLILFIRVLYWEL